MYNGTQYDVSRTPSPVVSGIPSLTGAFGYGSLQMNMKKYLCLIFLY